MVPVEKKSNPLVNLKPIPGCSLDDTLQSISFTVYWLEEQVCHEGYGYVRVLFMFAVFHGFAW